MNLSSVSTQLLYTTVPIWVEMPDGRQSFGTAFIYSIPVPGQQNAQFPLLITNYHVVAGGKRALIELSGKSGDVPDRAARSRVEIPGEFLQAHTDPSSDLAAVPIGGVLTQLEKSGRGVFFRSIGPDNIPAREVLDDLAAVEEVTFIGYPSGLYDQHNATPLFRRGITATPVWNDFQGNPAFLIDAGVFPGSSGSPVFILNEGAYTNKNGLVAGSRLLFLGVLTEAILRTEANAPNVFLGLGRVVKAQRLKEFASQIVHALPQPARPL